MKRTIKLWLISVQNLILFIVLALWHRVPFNRWTYAWGEYQAEHRAQVHKAVWALKCEGRIYEDEDGNLWPKR